MLLAALLLLCASGITAHAAESHDHSAYTALTAADTTLSQSGKYYLDGNLTLPSPLTVSGGDVELCLNGHMLTCTGGNYVIQVESGATLTVTDCFDESTHVGEEYAHSYVTPKSEERKPEYVAVTGGLITGNNERGCIQVSDGTLHLRGGTVAGGKTANGGGVSIAKTKSGAGALFLYAGARITDNAATGSGGGVFVPQLNRGGFTMLGGTIEDNSAVLSGGGVYVGIMSRFSMDGGTITQNRQTRAGTQAAYGGGGVFLHTSAALQMNGGTISNNTSQAKGGGVLLSAGCTVSLCGDVSITGSTGDGVDSDLTIYHNTMPQGLASIRLTGPLSNGAAIGLCYTRETLDTSVCFVTAEDNYHGGAVPVQDYEKFFSNDNKRALLWSTTQTIELCTGRIHAICGAHCAHGANGAQIHPQVILQSMSAGFTGGSLPAGAYYLEENITLTEPVRIDGGEVNLCLNGHELKNPGGRVFEIEAGGSLTLCDCYDAKTHTGEVYTHTYKNPQTKADVTVHGGLISGNHSLTSPSGGIEVNGGTLALFGGVIGGASGQGGVRLTNGARFVMSGGSVSDCLSGGSGGGIFADETSGFTMTGGQVTSNRARGMGGGIYAARGFSLSGNIRVIGNIVGAADNNVYLPQNTFIRVSGPVSGTVGITLECPGTFTAGGGAPYVSSFQADVREGAFVDVLGQELCISGYGIRVQPTPETRTVIAMGAEDVKSYQWYALDRQPLTLSDMTDSACAYDAANDCWTHSFTADADSLNCFSIFLNEGDTLRVTPFPGLTGVSLMREVTTAEGVVLSTDTFSNTPDYEGQYDVTAHESRIYTLCVASDTLWHSGDTLSVSVSLYRRGLPAAVQTGATFTGETGYQICRVVYQDGTTVLYSEPFCPNAHSHALCGKLCAHNSHDEAVFTPIAHTLSGDLLAGEGLCADFALQSGAYYLPADLKLRDSLVIPAGLTAAVCLNGHALHCENGSGIVVEPGAVLSVCDCGAGGTVSGQSAGDGGGMDIRGAVTLYAGEFSGGTAAGHGGGIYLAQDGTLTIAGGVQVTGNAPDNLFLAAGRTVTLLPDLPGTTAIGIAMERPGVFTSGAKETDMPYFSSDAAGANLVRAENGELALRVYSITQQPTAASPTVTVMPSEHAAYRWYTAAEEAVTSDDDPRYDAETMYWTPDETGNCFRVTADVGQILRVTLEAPDPKDILLTVNGLPMKASDGAYLLDIREQGTYQLKLSGAGRVKGALYTRSDALPDQIGPSLTAQAGAYLCAVTWPDGFTLWSDLLVIAENSGGTGDVYAPPVKQPLTIPFTDLSEDAWYYAYVCNAYQKGWMCGMDATRFCPDESMTRGMLVTILWRLSGAPAVSGAAAAFSDVPEDAYYSQAVAWAVQNGVTFGMDSTHFDPEREATREQSAAFFHRYADFLSVSLLGSNDMPSSWAADDMRWAVDAGVLVGYADGSLDPGGNVTRAQIAAMLERFMYLFET